MHSFTSSWSTYITMYRWPIASLTMLHLFPWPVRLSKAIIWGHPRLHVIKGRLLLRREKWEIPMWQLFYCFYWRFWKIKSNFSWHTILKLFICQAPNSTSPKNKNCFFSRIWTFIKVHFLSLLKKCKGKIGLPATCEDEKVRKNWTWIFQVEW